MGGIFGRLRLAALALCVFASACAGNDDAADRPSATVPTAVTTTTAPADPYAVPAVIDVAYLQRVLEALDRISGDAARIIVGQGRFAPEAAVRLRAVYDSGEFRRQQEQWLRTLDRGLGSLRKPPGNRRTTVERIINARPDCVFLAAAVDLSAVTSSEPAVAREFLAMRPIQAPETSRSLNPTPWMITAEGFNRDRSEPPDPCAAS